MAFFWPNGNHELYDAITITDDQFEDDLTAHVPVFRRDGKITIQDFFRVGESCYFFSSWTYKQYMAVLCHKLGLPGLWGLAQALPYEHFKRLVMRQVGVDPDKDEWGAFVSQRQIGDSGGPWDASLEEREAERSDPLSFYRNYWDVLPEVWADATRVPRFFGDQTGPFIEVMLEMINWRRKENGWHECEVLAVFRINVFREAGRFFDMLDQRGEACSFQMVKMAFFQRFKYTDLQLERLYVRLNHIRMRPYEEVASFGERVTNWVSYVAEFKGWGPDETEEKEVAAFLKGLRPELKGTWTLAVTTFDVAVRAAGLMEMLTMEAAASAG
ncbi:uncharacterized protein LOC143036533 [Oratosquilla oratoria]|uniref:uncharacterized protein LOC143036533 n=1 Tax=Oratosquilla oratoria TaxID=337810 RepID=UPI003F75843B